MTLRNVLPRWASIPRRRPSSQYSLRVESLESRNLPSHILLIPTSISIVDDPLHSSVIFNSTGAVTMANKHTGQGSGVCHSRGSRGHAGTDLEAPVGTPVYAVAAGVVTAIRTDWHGQKGRSGAPGNYVVIQHVVNGVPFVSEYFHLLGGNIASLAGINLKVGDQIAAGEEIGFVGQTGNASKKGFVPHLHFELHLGTTIPKKNGFPTGPSYCPIIIPPPPYVPPPPPPPPPPPMPMCDLDGDEPFPCGPDSDGDSDVM
jgi:murein DD-endopeptidase MepM/ murein hydrolase activator NlpD